MRSVVHVLTLALLAIVWGGGENAAAQKTLKGNSLFGSVRARHIGPAVMSGRVSDLVASNQTPELLYVGAAGGGVWKSVNGGAVFFPVFDDYTQSIGKLAIDPQHDDTVWVGTGETWVRNSVSVGDGIYRSANGGSTWEKKGLENTERIADIIIHPTNSNTLYVAAMGHLWNSNPDRGVYKTTDGGATWDKILFIDDNTGCADLAIDPTNPDILYASMWEFRRSPDFFSSGGMGSGVHKSTDAGKTWTKIQTGLPSGKLGRMAIEVAPSNANKLYLTVECETKADNGLYRSEDAGANWKHINGGFNCTVRPFYFARLQVDPTDEKIVYKCGLNLTVSEDGGESFRTIGSGVHSDIHAVWVNPKNNKHVYIGTDGGAYRSLDGAHTFEMFMNLPLTQFYAIKVDNAEPYNVYGGLQDNGSWYGPSSAPGGIQNSAWKMTNFGDGFHSVPHPTDENTVYSESQGGNVVRHDKRDGQVKDIKPSAAKGDPEYRWNWNTPIYVSPNDPERLYVAAQYVFRSNDRGDSWTKISPDLTTNDPKLQRQKKSGGLSIDNSTAENNTTVYALSESPKNGNTLWAGTDDGKLQVTTDAGKTWTDVTPNITGLPANYWCTTVEAGHFDANTAYVTFDGHRSGDKKPYVYKTTDLGKTWTSLVTDDIDGYALSFVEDLQKENLLFVGTEFGLYVSIDAGATWARFTNNMPKVGVRAMVIHPRDGALVMGTHGRGVIIIDDLEPLRLLTPELMAKKFAFLPSKPAVLKVFAGGAPFGGAGNFVGQNPDESASISYYMSKRHTFGKMNIEVYGPDGVLIRKLPAGKSAGINIVPLPTRMDKPKAAPTNNRMALGGSFFGPNLPEGTYTVKIIKGKETFTSTVELQADPKTLYSAEDRKKNSVVLMSLYHMQEQVGHLYYAAEGLAKQADAFAESNPKLAKKLGALSKKANDFKATLAASDGDFYVDEGSILIREKVSKIYFSVVNYPGAPSASQLARTKELETEVAGNVDLLVAMQKDIDKLNGTLTKEGGKGLALMTFEEYKSN
jgi:photosystem II stability/assembly factor-like uncharacterized protein